MKIFVFFIYQDYKNQNKTALHTENIFMASAGSFWNVDVDTWISTFWISQVQM